MKKILFSSWLFLPIAIVAITSSTLQSKGVVKPIFSIFNVVDLTYFLLGGLLIYFAYRRKVTKGRS